MAFTGTEFEEWLGPNRSEVQQALIDLYSTGQKIKHRLGEQHSKERVWFALLVGAGFSLWRAVFTVHQPLTEQENLDTSLNFLGILIRTNAINFSQEQYSWSFGFYLNNARYRLVDVLELLPDVLRPTLTPHIAMLEGAAKRTPQRDPEIEYKEAHDAFLFCVEAFCKYMDPQTKAKLPPRNP